MRRSQLLKLHRALIVGTLLYFANFSYWVQHMWWTSQEDQGLANQFQTARNTSHVPPWKSVLQNATTLRVDIYRARSANCGLFKCYFTSKFFPGYGYLVAKELNSMKPFLDKGWDLARKLKMIYGIRHFLVSPPVPVVCNRELATVFHSLQKGHVYSASQQLLVQVVQTAPANSLAIQVKKIERAYSEMNTFLVTTSANFSDRVRQEWDDTKRLLEKEPRLYNDFQIILDSSGRIWHFDFDRVWGNPASDAFQRTVDTEMEWFMGNLTQFAESDRI